MSAGLSSTAKAELYAQTCTEDWLVLLNVSHADLGSTLRYVSDYASVTSRGNVYTPLAFGARLPRDTDGPIQALIILDNTDRTVVADIRSITTEASVTIEVIRRTDPNTVLRTYPYLQLRGAQIHGDQVHLELGSDPVDDESYPGLDFTPLDFPGGFDR